MRQLHSNAAGTIFNAGKEASAQTKKKRSARDISAHHFSLEKWPFRHEMGVEAEGIKDLKHNIRLDSPFRIEMGHQNNMRAEHRRLQERRVAIIRSHYVFGVVSAHEFKQKDREFVIRDPFFIRKMEIKRVFHTNSLSSIHALSPIFQ
jgi:hypothetical protein